MERRIKTLKKKLPFSQKKLNELKKLFKKEKRIVAVYLFGSSIRGEETPVSDLDLALATQESFSLEEKAPKSKPPFLFPLAS